MAYIVLGVHLFICIGLIGLVLLQRSEGGALGMGGGGGGSLMSGRGAADALARMTSFAGAFFLATSLLLTVISGSAQSSNARSVFDLAPQTREPVRSAPAPVTEPARPDPTESSVAPETQLASTPTTGIEIAPAPAAASTRASPVAGPAAAPARPTTTAGPLTNQPRTQPASAAATTTQRPAATTAPRTTTPASGSTPSTSAPRPAATNPPVAPIDLPATQLDPESSQGDGITEPVRRERAGPDQ